MIVVVTDLKNFNVLIHLDHLLGSPDLTLNDFMPSANYCHL